MQAERITNELDGQTLQGYLAVPEGPGPHRGVVVIQEWWGLNAHIEEVARRLAAAGYVAFAPDLYHGSVATEPDEARKLRMELDMPAAAAELAAAARYLVSRPDVQPARVAVIGFCLGGSLALLLAASSPHVAAVASFYGIPGGEDAEAQLRRISAPVLGIYGAEDTGIPAERREQLAHILRASGVTHEQQVYEGAPHAFFNDTRPQAYRPEAAQDAWRRALEWFDRYLG